MSDDYDPDYHDFGSNKPSLGKVIFAVIVMLFLAYMKMKWFKV